MIWYILLALLAMFGIIALIASTKPDEWTIQRQARIPADPAKIFPYLDDLHKFLAWSPWAQEDPNIKLSFGDQGVGRGAQCAWEGNGKVGAGNLTITESRPNELLRCRFDFSKPLKCTNLHEFGLQADGSQTIMTWTMSGKAPFFFKLILVFVSCDSMMADKLELGLANLKQAVAG